ncbi:tol-pal system-associated acyl-CoA thioesterase [Actibacterium sp. 188UL27-1]|uniref:tol-pal system-associated acyl-CoA thioesterase n=1 Tax=Actibacterium sp. 188UL27-1 TaxID=2786961 RepID=UPI0019578CFF|nr:tol-pal system-associated acyl-CoA thioesterase [Actibacterium sp. 188UL27-1]MBM7068235.1 tol-pal system-associated acyl-CoA thioesterase [Actibacterium sp. 188UL27-1]
MATYTHTLRVYYEDTDMGGIVYYANYLKFIERGRSDWVRAIGMDQNAMKDDHGIVFVVRRVEAEYLAPARLDDVLTVETQLSQVKGARFTMDQRVLRAEQPLFTAKVDIAIMTLAGKPTRLPAEIRALLTP